MKIPALRRTGLGFLILGLPLAMSAAVQPPAPVLQQDDFDRDLRQWSLEQAAGGRASVQDGCLVIEDTGGTTLWFREKLTAPVQISYEVEVVDRGGPQDRLSDLNCFWMAQDPSRPAGALPTARSGRFADYDNLLTYYVGYGGNDNTTTRFRRYDGTGARPLRPEHDLRDPAHLLKANHVYTIRIVVQGNSTEYWRDGEKVFAFTDPAPLTSGYFAFRTVRSHLIVRHFKVTRPAPQS